MFGGGSSPMKTTLIPSPAMQKVASFVNIVSTGEKISVSIGLELRRSCP